MVRTKVFVGNLSFQTKEAELASEFAAAGKVISANIITRGPRSLGYGFVELDSEEDAQNAVKMMNKKEINTRPINVEIAKPQDETKERQPRPPRPEGEEGSRRRPRRRQVRKTDGEGETDENSKEEEGEVRRPRRRPHVAPGQKRISNEEKEESKTTLFVANLPFSLDDEAFSKIVVDLGLKLKGAHVVKKRNNRSKGYGFIEFETEEEQLKALAALNKKVVDSRELSVKVALTEIKHENEKEEKEIKPVPTAKPIEKKASPPPAVATSPEKKVPAEKKAAPPAAVAAVPSEKKATPPPAEKKTVPAEKKAAPPAVAVAAVPSEKKATPPVEKKTTPPSEKKTTPPAEKKTVPAEKKAAPADKKTATPEKKEEKK